MKNTKQFWHKNFLKSIVRQAFTLAEVMFTIAIVGAIAALTIPSINQTIQQAVLTAQTKKVYSVLEQSYTVSLENGGIDGYGGYTCPTSPNTKWAALKSNLNIIKSCNGNSFGNCWAAGGVSGIISGGCSNFNQATQNVNSSFVMSDGAAVMIYGNDSSYCDQILVDVNGPNNGPNQIGIDVFGGWFLGNNTIQIYPNGCDAGITNQSGLNYITK